MVDFVDYLIPQSAATSDIDIASADGNTIPWELLTTIREMDGVKEVYGRHEASGPAGRHSKLWPRGRPDAGLPSPAVAGYFFRLQISHKITAPTAKQASCSSITAAAPIITI